MSAGFRASPPNSAAVLETFWRRHRGKRADTTKGTTRTDGLTARTGRVAKLGGASPCQGTDEDVQVDATRVNPTESLASPRPSREAVVPADATECSPFTDAGLTRSERSPPASIAVIADDRLLTVADICGLLQIRKSVVYRACDRGDLGYVKSRVLSKLRDGT